MLWIFYIIRDNTLYDLRLTVNFGKRGRVLKQRFPPQDGMPQLTFGYIFRIHVINLITGMIYGMLYCVYGLMVQFLNLIEQHIMTDNQESQDNESFLNQAEYQQIKKKIALSSAELIELTYHEDKFNSKLQEFNSIACRYIQDDKYPQATAYLDQAEKILQYAAGCGKTIERCLITTILNNQACVLQRISDFEQSANYLEAIIFNIIDFLDNSHSPFSVNSQILNSQTQQFIELSIYFERKLSLALYHLRFCALSSHCKKNELALESAKKSLSMLKKLCEEEYIYQDYLVKNKSKCTIDSILQKTTKQQQKNILKECSKIKEISDYISEQDFQKYLYNAVQNLKIYHDKMKDSKDEQLEEVFINYSIGNLMQASIQQIMLKPNYQMFVENEFSYLGKVYKVVHIAMAYFTIATELRLMSSSKYSLDDAEKKNSQQFKQSKIYHLVSILVLSKFMPSKSVFFDHALSSFKNHYGINLMELCDGQKYQYKSNPNKSFELFDSEIMKESQSSEHQSENKNTDQSNKTVQVHSSKELQHLNIQKIMNLCEPKQKSPFQAKQISNKEGQDKKNKVKDQKYLKLYTQYNKLDSKAKDSTYRIHSKNKENKSRSKLLSKNKDLMKTSKKMIKTRVEEQNKRSIYYGYNNSKSKSRSRSKSKRNLILQKKLNNKALQVAKSSQIKKIKNDYRIDEEYGVQNIKTTAVKRKKSTKCLKNSYGFGPAEEQNVNSIKINKTGNFPVHLKKLKSPRNSKLQGQNKRLSKERLNF